MQDRFCRADGRKQLLADIRQSCSMADSSGPLRYHVGCCGVVAARANPKALRPSSPPIVSCFADNDTNETLREAKPLARLALLSGGCRLVQKAAFDADAHHRQTRLTHSEQGGHSQRFGGQDRTLRALVSICRASALRWLWAHRRHAQPKFRTRSSSRRELRDSGSLSGSVRIDRVLARPPPPRTRNDSRDAACSSLRGALATKRSRLPLRGGLDCLAALAMTMWKQARATRRRELTSGQSGRIFMAGRHGPELRHA
ncbi:hypothetical protein ABH975_006718 [Bradyrhizobium ottawaense]